MTQKYYILNISASDSGDPVYSSYTQLNISVTDYNDNQPVFSKAVYTVGVGEDIQPGSVIAQLTASDADSGWNAQVGKYYVFVHKQVFWVRKNLRTPKLKLTKTLESTLYLQQSI